MLLYATFETDKDDHRVGQSEVMSKVYHLGIKYYDAKWSSASSYPSGKRTHTVAIKCTKEQELLIRLSASEVSTNAYDEKIAEIANAEREISRLQYQILKTKEEVMWNA